MTNCMAIPFDSYNQRKIITDNLHKKGQRYSDLGGFIYFEEYFYDEPTAARLVKNYKNNIATL